MRSVGQPSLGNYYARLHGRGSITRPSGIWIEQSSKCRDNSQGHPEYQIYITSTKFNNSPQAPVYLSHQIAKLRTVHLKATFSVAIKSLLPMMSSTESARWWFDNLHNNHVKYVQDMIGTSSSSYQGMKCVQVVSPSTLLSCFFGSSCSVNRACTLLIVLRSIVLYGISIVTHHGAFGFSCSPVLVLYCTYTVSWRILYWAWLNGTDSEFAFVDCESNFATCNWSRAWRHIFSSLHTPRWPKFGLQNRREALGLLSFEMQVKNPDVCFCTQMQC